MKLVFLLLFAVCSGCAEKTSNMSALLPQAQVQVLLKQCSRANPANVSSLWEVPSSIAQDIDLRIIDVSKLRTPQGKAITEPKKYLRQYGGVVANGRKLVYINAFYLPSQIDPNELKWRVKATVVCDGGSTAWGAMYDPVIKSFSHLNINSQLGGA